MDVARGAALVAMIVYHFCFDLVLFGFVDWGVSTDLPWRIFAAAIASSFLFLTGVSLVLAHGDGVRWRAFARRLAILAGAAALVSLATTFAMPQAPIYFGILHAIATFSVLGLPFVFAPAWVSAVAAVAFIATHHLVTLPLPTVLSYPLGLAAVPPVTLDHEPIFPWLGATLLGVALGRSLLSRRHVGDGRSAAGNGNLILLVFLTAMGRRSLIIYLFHQPVLFAILLPIAFVQANT